MKLSLVKFYKQSYQPSFSIKTDIGSLVKYENKTDLYYFNLQVSSFLFTGGVGEHGNLCVVVHT